MLSVKALWIVVGLLVVALLLMSRKKCACTEKDLSTNPPKNPAATSGTAMFPELTVGGRPGGGTAPKAPNAGTRIDATPIFGGGRVSATPPAKPTSTVGI